MDNKREQERDELHKSIWKIANDLRGSVDGWDFKQYVLGTLFYRYISENFNRYITEGEHKAGNTEFNYAEISDDEAEEIREDAVQERGYFILPSQLFCNVHAKAKDNENLNETIENVFKEIEKSAIGHPSEENFKGLFDDIDVNSNKLGPTVAKRNETLVKLLNGIAGMKLGEVYENNTIDAFGDTYEYLMGMYASNAGKSGGEYYTPQEVSELLTRLAIVGKREVNKVYDPACGSGSLLLKSAKISREIAEDGKPRLTVRQGYYGQEINITTYNLCRINMFLHNIGYDKFDIALGDTLTAPAHMDDEPFEVIVSNPPYSIKWKGDSDTILINDERFSPAGVLAPKSKADLAFVMHMLSWLSANGTAAIVCFPGVMYRGGTEKKIRQYLIDNNFVDCIIQLPENLFYGTTIATCIMVLKKCKKENSTLFIDASKEFVKVTNNNKLTDENIKHIVDTFAFKLEKEHYSKLVHNKDIAESDYNLTVSTYVEPEDTKESINIIELNKNIADTVTREQVLRNKIDELIADTNLLLTFNDSVEKKCFKDIGTITRGNGLKKTDLTNAGVPCIHYGQIYTYYGIYTYTTKSYVTKETAESLKHASKNDIVIAVTSENIEDVCKCVAWLGEQDIVVGGHIAILKHNQNPKYIAYYLQTEMFFQQKRKLAHGTKVIEITPKELENIVIPIPSLEEQERIVNILDSLDKQYNELTQQIEAEVSSRHKQYEYYRDKLLSFKELQTADELVAATKEES